MKASLWRAVALVVIAAAAAFVAYDTLLAPAPDLGIRTTHPAARSMDLQRVTSVTPHSPAERAGIRPGDTISFGGTPLQRAESEYALPGTRIAVVVNGSEKTLVVPASSSQTMLIAPFVIRLAFLAVAALLAWRRPEDSAARALVLFLLCYALMIGLPNNLMPNPLLSVIVLQTGSTVLLLTGTAAAATFAAEFPSGIAQPVPRRLARTTQLLVALGVVLAIVGTLFATADRVVGVVFGAITAIFIVAAVSVVAILILSYVQGAPSERERRRWVFLFMGIGLSAILIDIAVQASLGYSEAVDIVTLFLIGAVPFGLAYVILRHRVIDVGFVINRALVYGAVSVIIVGIFVVVETLMSKYVERHSRAGSIAVQLAVALVLGFSIRFIHARVDGAVDRVFFRQRYLDEAAMAEFTLDAHYITVAETLLERCVATVLRHAHASAAGVWLRDEAGLYRPQSATFAGAAPVDENDPALVAMRARRVVADLHGLGSALPGALAFPMIVRGQLVGALLCGPKKLAEAYDPDETAALREMASAVGHALDGMRIRELEERLQSLETSRRAPTIA